VKKPLLIVDFEFSGHHALHLRHIVRYGLMNTGDTVRFLIPQKLLERTLQTLTEAEQRRLLPCVKLLEDDPVWGKMSSILRKPQLACWAYFEYLNLKHRQERILLVYLESVFYGVAFSPLPRFDVSCLMFRPTFYYAERGMLSPGWKDRLIFALKWFGAYLLRLRPGITKVLTLDPLAEEHGRKHWGTTKFECIPDPLGPEPGMSRPVAAAPNGPKQTLHLLLAGALGPRKGLKETMDAFEVTPVDVRRRYILTVMGEPDKQFVDYVRVALERAKAMGLRVNENLRFVSDAELDAAMEAADLVLVAYRGFKGSSGMLIRAAHFGKPVISTDDGLLSYFVRSYQLGAAIDVGNPATFAAHMENFLLAGKMDTFDPLRARKYADDSEPQFFVDKLLGL